MEIKNKDFVKIEFDLYANDKLVQTTNGKKATEAGLKLDHKGPMTIIIGKNFIVKAVDEDILKAKDNKIRTLNLAPKNAYGKRDKNNMKTISASAFVEHKQRPVVGMMYDFNGDFGVVKSVIGGRVMVDFNNVLAGKDIKIEYKIVEKIEKIDEKISFVFENALKLPKNMFKTEVKEKNITIEVPEQLLQIEEMLIKSFAEFIPEIKDFTIKIQKFKK